MKTKSDAEQLADSINERFNGPDTTDNTVGRIRESDADVYIAVHDDNFAHFQEADKIKAAHTIMENNIAEAIATLRKATGMQVKLSYTITPGKDTAIKHPAMYSLPERSM